MEKLIHGFNNYVIDENGIVRNINTLRKLKQTKSKDGYLYVILYDKDTHKKQCKYIHKLVAETFIPNEDNLPVVDHINTITTDNRVENLRWTTVKGNCNNEVSKINKSQAAKRRTSYFVKEPLIAINANNVTITFDSMKEAEKAGFTRSLIYKVLKNQRNTHKGFKFYALD